MNYAESNIRRLIIKFRKKELSEYVHNDMISSLPAIAQAIVANYAPKHHFDSVNLRDSVFWLKRRGPWIVLSIGFSRQKQIYKLPSAEGQYGKNSLACSASVWDVGVLLDLHFNVAIMSTIGSMIAYGSSEAEEVWYIPYWYFSIKLNYFNLLCII